MIRSQLAVVLAAMLLAFIAMAAAAPSHTTTAVHHKGKTTTTKKHHSSSSSKHVIHTTTKPHHKSTTTKKPHPKTTTTKKPHPKATTTTVPHKATTTIKPHTTSTKPKPTGVPGKKGFTGTIKSAKDYCVFLPPTYGGDIALNEDRAVAFCTSATLVPGSRVIPKGFIQSAHFLRNATADWVQITGRINRSAYGLAPTDGGGQYDMRAPIGASCAGYNSFVQLTEPDAEIFCIRCCASKLDCPVNKSTHGCEKVLGGNYV
ncbi:hypothetical protein BGZ83_002218 [Gryganskiella cystojenkinii]|nr:hypothetical protein BGZ83_002218 [Gryganskiella cystojenkinii]